MRSVSEWYSVMDMAEKTGIPHQTLRRYMTSHSHLLKMKKQHKAYQIHEECIDTFNKMRELYSDGKTQEQVDSVLASTGITVTIDMPNENGEQVSVNVASVLVNIQDKMNEQENHIKELTESIRMQSKQIDQQQQYIKESLEMRDRLLMESLKESQETRKQIAVAEEEKKKGGFWSRLFGGN